MTQAIFDALTAARPRLEPKDHEFADSLLAQYQRGRAWSPKQAYWAGKLAERADAPKPVVTRVVDDLSGILAVLDTARAHLKEPGFRVLLDQGGQFGEAPVLRIKQAGGRSRYPGQFHLSDDVSWDDRRYFGRLDLQGQFHPSRDVTPADEKAVKAALARFGADPVGEAQRYARLYGRCCFCNLELTDPRSTAVGYGPDCAKNYGLPWKPAEVTAAKRVTKKAA